MSICKVVFTGGPCGGKTECLEVFREQLRQTGKSVISIEETGIEINDEEIERPFMKVTYLNKDWPEVGKNRKAEIYYYLIKTSKEPDLTKVNYTEHEKQGNFKIEKIPLSLSIDFIRKNIPNNEKNKVIAPDMIMAIEEYLHQCGE